MADTAVTNSCGACRAPLAESPSTLVEDCQPCPDCGSTTRHVEVSVTETITVHEMVGLKARHRDHGQPFREAKSGEELHRDTGEWREVYRVIDRENDRYDEVIRSADGLVVREVHEPLSEHRGRGAARRREDAE